MVQVRAFGNVGEWTVGSVQRGEGADGLGLSLCLEGSIATTFL